MKSVRKAQMEAARRRKRRGRGGMLAALSIFAAVIIILLASGGAQNAWMSLTGLFTQKTAESTAAHETSASEAQTTRIAAPTPTMTPTPTEPPVIRVTLAAVGDIILHQAVIDGGLIEGSSPAAYNFDKAFQYVKPILSGASLALANYEGTLNGPPYSGYPRFCAPDEIADALRNAGVDVAWTANNHTIDRGLDGVIRTASIFREKGFAVIGTRPDTSSPADAVVDAGGIKIGLMAYTFETIGTDTQKALNGIPMPAEADPLIDSFNPYRPAAFEKDLEAMLARAAALREQGAEMICLSLHWGIEYKTRSCSYQRSMAQRLADAGIEIIIGHHPHVLQEIDVLTSETTGKPTLVFYSLSNFLHNMEYITHDTAGKALDGVIARVGLIRDENGVRVEYAEYIPTTVVRAAKEGNPDRYQHLIVPVIQGLADPAAFQTTEKEMQASLDRITAVLGDSKGSDRIPVRQAEK